MKTRYIKPESVKALEALALKRTKEQYPNFPYPPKQSYRDDKTNDLTRCVIDFVNLNNYQAERINSTGQQINLNGKTKWIKGSGQVGTSDISATIKGRSIKIEIKCEGTRDNYQSKDQIEYQKQIERAGGVYIVIRNFTQFYDWFNAFVN
ncbi:hypothetical protein [Flavobacterium sp. N2038]|uniref:hypothetical protein n=1 Tax=Flavobacterium sp. N2038 TaxID=2986829 RepID=UPI0022250E4F|nr:hypothetical protein [Flavobacterium sp. N2038]